MIAKKKTFGKTSSVFVPPSLPILIALQHRISSSFSLTINAIESGPLQKTTNRQEYNKVVDGLMYTRGITREEAEKEYNAYLDNPNNYALEKGEAYYKSLGYKKLMDGVIGEVKNSFFFVVTKDNLLREELYLSFNFPTALLLNKTHFHNFDSKSLFRSQAEKEGRGEEVRARVEKFRKDSNLKGLITIGAFIALGFYLKITYPYVPPPSL